MFTHLLPNNLSKIRNAFSTKKKEVEIVLSNTNISIVRLLKAERLIWDFTIFRAGNFFWIRLKLKYHNGTPTIQNILQTSKSGRRIYKTTNQLRLYSRRGGLILVMTNRGLLSHKTASKLGVGGEVLCYIS
ncbi:putative 30S ribosomal subunit protein S8 [Candidatus Tremblaya phenacola PAVE]|nr:putative 30S ribosomal subunit protein S8 [Candidatus Tremblaya phenacola PAVE]